ncbi:MAG: hypothetical protein M1813_003950 [Trichoglossum hirsutum]|nr:MAG: hypothetical protein M1813_003950 [Trichoglossum hirsutum]
MARRSTKISRKRSPPTVAATRQSKRLKADGKVSVRTKNQAQIIKPTPKRSKYFEPQTASYNDKDEDDEELGGSELESDHLNESSYEHDAVATPTPAESEDEGTDYSEENTKLKIRRGTTGSRSTLKAKLPTGRELLKEGVKAGLGPGKEVRVKLPKAREAGDIPYQADRIHPNTLLFLQDLRNNNERDWLKCKAYLQSS